MTEVLQMWAIPHPPDMEPLPVLLRKKDEWWEIASYDRRDKRFHEFAGYGKPRMHAPDDFFKSFDECRIEIIARNMKHLSDTREQCKLIAANIEHVRNLPIATFPDVVREVPETQQQEAEEKKEAKAEEVKPEIVKPQPKRSR